MHGGSYKHRKGPKRTEKTPKRTIMILKTCILNTGKETIGLFPSESGGSLNVHNDSTLLAEGGVYLEHSTLRVPTMSNRRIKLADNY